MRFWTWIARQLPQFRCYMWQISVSVEITSSFVDVVDERPLILLIPGTSLHTHGICKTVSTEFLNQNEKGSIFCRFVLHMYWFSALELMIATLRNLKPGRRVNRCGISGARLWDTSRLANCMVGLWARQSVYIKASTSKELLGIFVIKCRRVFHIKLKVISWNYFRIL